MTQRFFRTSILAVLAFAASHTILSAQERKGIEGIWSVSVTVVNCQTAAPIRTVASLQQFRSGGTMVETANTASRGISEGVWNDVGDDTISASYWFYRYNPDGTFASRATVTDKIDLGAPGHFTSIGVVTDYDANGNLLTTGCFTHTANRLAIERGRQGD